MPSLSIVVPVYNEAKNVSLLYAEVVDALPHADWELIFVDDCSTDDTPKEIAALVQSNSRVRGFRLRCNTHKSGALQRGFAEAKAEVVVTLDGDLQDVPSEIPHLLAAIEAGADMAVGWRKIRSDRMVAKLLPSLVINTLTNIVLGQKFHDMNSGFKAYRKDILQYIALQGSLFRFTAHLLSREGYKVVEVPVQHRARKHGKSKFSLRHRLRSLFDVCTVFFLARFSDRPLHFFGSIGGAVFFAGALCSLYLAALWIQTRAIGQRPLLLVGALLLIVGVQIMSIGLIGELLIHTQDRKKAVPYYPL